VRHQPNLLFLYVSSAFCMDETWTAMRFSPS